MRQGEHPRAIRAKATSGRDLSIPLVEVLIVIVNECFLDDALQQILFDETAALT
jgi:hypothetical protein